MKKNGRISHTMSRANVICGALLLVALIFSCDSHGAFAEPEATQDHNASTGWNATK